MIKSELVFIPSPGIGHVISTVEIAKLLIDRDDRLSVTVLIMKMPSQTKFNSTTTTNFTSTPRLRFVDLPHDESTSRPINPRTFFTIFIDSHKPHVREALSDIVRSESTQLVGLVVDMFCTTMIDVANEFRVPTYVYFTSSAAMLGLMFHLQALTDEHHPDVTELNDSETELIIPSFVNPVPSKVLPLVVLDKEGGSDMLMGHARRFRGTKGIFVNTFFELESHAVKSLSNITISNIPPVYPVGPILNLEGDESKVKETDKILNWLDGQPSSSVVFLCFGSMGSFGETQVKEIAKALESSQHRFLWSLRRPPPKGATEFPGEYSNPEEVLPEGFLERTRDLGKVIGWAPQVAVLSHPAVGGFVSHCGWNSTLESIWCGVPIATWPVYAEQQLNAFEMVKELGMAAEVRMDYRRDWRNNESEIIVTAEEIEKGIKCLMAKQEMREKVKEMKEKSRMAVAEGGSSYTTIGRLIDDVLDNITP